jgi:signal transduction histidine kinase
VRLVRRSFFSFAVAATLLVLLGVLGTLQYRWLGEVSNAERERLRATLRTRATDFSRDFDREITHAYMAFRADPELFSGNAAAVLSDAYARAQADSTIGGIIKSVYFVEVEAGSVATLKLLDPTARTLSPIEWPAEFDAWRRRTTDPASALPGLPPLLFGDAIDAKIPALVVALPAVKRIASDGRFTIVHDASTPTRVAILRLDEERLRRQLLDSLVERHFGAAGTSEYFVAVTTREPNPRLIYATSPAANVSAANADVAAGLFDLRLDELRTFTAKVPPPGSSEAAEPPAIKDRVAVTIVRRTDSGGPQRVLMAGGEAQGAWQVLIRGKAGSLESLVVRSRNRNLAIGLGILGLLAASLVFVIGSAQRQHRLARQQMEFVAAVSHELRTPLAVIRSAGENLADGVVNDGEQVKQYGSLIRTEGRRLSDMVERVMEYAGMTSSAAVRTRDDVDIARIVGDAAGGVAPEARERGVAVAAQAEAGLPPIVGDPDALRAAVENVIANAVKYSAPGGLVEVNADLDGNRLRVSVTDRGIGIDAADLPHVFKPFYRGRRALDAQIRGTGVGLSVVRHVVDAHQGQITIESRAGEGTRVVLTFPAAIRRDRYVSEGAAARAAT